MAEKILSIQSHVVSGYVGNRCAVFLLQILKNEVDFINSVQFSNHTAYENIKGTSMQGGELAELYQGLALNKIDKYAAVLTGYIGSSSFLEQIVQLVRDVKLKNPRAKYYCDPVMGDNGKMYVPSDLLSVYQTQILSIADVIFPNQCEASLLTGNPIENEGDVIAVMEQLHEKGPHTVILTSTDFNTSADTQHCQNILFAYASRRSRTNDAQQIKLRMQIPKIDCVFVGTGDVFSALFLAWDQKHPDDLKLTCSRVIGSMQAIIRKTFDSIENPDKTNCRPEEKELKLIHCVESIINPPPFGDIEIF